MQEVQGNYQVAVLGQDDTVHIRPVKVGPRYEGVWVIADGLKPGERVVAEGLQKIRDGVKVLPKPYVEESTGKPTAPVAATPG